MHRNIRFIRCAGIVLAVFGFLTLQAVEAADASSESPSLQLRKARAEIAARRWSEAEPKLSQIWNQTPVLSQASEAGVLLIDVYLHEEKSEQAEDAVQKFKRQFGTSPQMARVLYYQGLLALIRGANDEAAQAFASAALRSHTQDVYDDASLALHRIVESGGLHFDDLQVAWQSLVKDTGLGPWLLEKVGENLEQQGRYQTAQAVYSDYLERYPQSEGVPQVRAKLEHVKEAPHEERAVLLMAPFSGEFAEVGRSLREGALLAFEEAKARGVATPNVKILDDQGNLVQGVRQLRKLLREERVDAIVGPAMSDVAAGVAIELSASKSPIPLITPTATTQGIASLGDGVFQLNVTTQVLGQRIAAYASDCLDLKDFAIVAPQSEYGFQLAAAFSETVLKKGGNVVSVTYVDPDAADLSQSLEELHQKVADLFFDKMKQAGLPLPDERQMRSYMSDSTLPIDGIFIPAASGDEADKLASQIIFNKVRGQMLGSSGWYDKSLFLKNSEATQGAYFSVDFQDQPRTEAYAAFSTAYRNQWKRSPDRVAALSYDATRFLLEGMQNSSEPKTLIPALRAIKTFPGVLGDIDFGEDEANQNTAVFRLERRSFKEAPDCAAAQH